MIIWVLIAELREKVSCCFTNGKEQSFPRIAQDFIAFKICEFAPTHKLSDLLRGFLHIPLIRKFTLIQRHR